MARLFLASTLVLSTALGFLTLTNGHDWGDDFAEYLMQTESVVQGRTREFIEEHRFVIENSTELIGPFAYPWGYPLCLAPVYYFCGLNNLIALKCVNLLFFNLALLCAYALFVRRIGPALSCLLVALLAFNPVLLGFLDNILSDALFLFLAMLSVFLVDKFLIRAEYLGGQALSYVLLGVSAFAAMSARPNGVVLLPLIFICQTVESASGRHPSCRRSRLLSLATATIPYVTCMALKWFTTPILPDGGGGVVSYFYFSWLWVAKNSVYYIGMYAKLFGVRYQCEVLFALSLPLVILGMKARWRQDYHLLSFVALNQLLYTVWPGRGPMRYVLPMMPFYLYFMFQGVMPLRQSLAVPILGSPQRTGFICGVVLTGIMFAESSYFACCNMQNERNIAGPFAEQSAEMFDYVKRKTAKEARFMFFKPRALGLMTGRLAFASHRPEDLAKVDYLVIHKNFARINQIREPASEALEQVFENSTFVIYRVRDKN